MEASSSGWEWDVELGSPGDQDSLPLAVEEEAASHQISPSFLVLEGDRKYSVSIYIQSTLSRRNKGGHLPYADSLPNPSNTQK